MENRVFRTPRHKTMQNHYSLPPASIGNIWDLRSRLIFSYIFLGLFGQSHEPVCDARGAIANTKQKDFHFVYTNILACFPG